MKNTDLEKVVVEKNEDCIVLAFADVYKRLDKLIQLMLSSKLKK